MSKAVLISIRHNTDCRKINRLERVCFPAELHVGDRAWKKAMSILDKKYAEAKKLPFIRDPLAWALYHTWREFDNGKRCD